MNGSLTIPVMTLVFVCGILAGFGVYAMISSGTQQAAIYTANAPEPIGPYSQAVRGLPRYVGTDRSRPGHRHPP
mgnify:CR=1 FL=1